MWARVVFPKPGGPHSKASWGRNRIPDTIEHNDLCTAVPHFQSRSSGLIKGLYKYYKTFINMQNTKYMQIDTTTAGNTQGTYSTHMEERMEAIGTSVSKWPEGRLVHNGKCFYSASADKVDLHQSRHCGRLYLLWTSGRYSEGGGRRGRHEVLSGQLREKDLQ